MIMNTLKRKLYFKLAQFILSYKPHSKEKVLYLTFDDGPEPDITEFVLDQLAKYKASATFFCCGHNYEAYPLLIKKIVDGGYALGNHTYSHINGLDANTDAYVHDVKRMHDLCMSILFRPPWGQISIHEYNCIKKFSNKIVMWDVTSYDTLTSADINQEWLLEYWNKNVKSGSIILFHFCKKHEASTKLLLPLFLDTFSKQGYRFIKID